jgi:CRP/FNR family transcriptional regulator, nitrogen fixation regulation protein
MTRKAISVACHGPLHCHGDPSRQPRRLAGLESLATITSYHRSQEVCSQAGPADYWYCVISGTARRYMIRSDGRRQIVDLLLPGDFFGFSVGDEYDFTVEAVAQGTTVARYPRRPVEARADTDPQLARDIRQIAFEALSRLQAQLLTVGRITAREKVGSFLLDMAERLANESADQVLLPVSRYDIADYLALSVETVSRSLTDLKHHGVIKLLGSRSVRILDRDSLEEGMRDARAGQLDVGRSANRMCSRVHSANSVRGPH